MTADAKELSSVIVFASEGCEPTSPTAQDGRADGNRLDVSHSGWASIKACICWEGRLKARLAWLALEAFNKALGFACGFTVSSPQMYAPAPECTYTSKS